MTHASVPIEDRIKLGITDNLIRLSVGIENIEDLLADIDRALNASAVAGQITGVSKVSKKIKKSTAKEEVFYSFFLKLN